MCGPDERGFADNLGEEKPGLAFSSWESSPVVISLGEGSLGSAPLCMAGVGWRWLKGAPWGSQIVAVGGESSPAWHPAVPPLLPTLQMLCVTSLKRLLQGWSAVFCPLWAPSVFHRGCPPGCHPILLRWWWWSSQRQVPWCQAGTSWCVITAALRG